MKKMLVLAAVLVLVPAIAGAAIVCNPGTYKADKLVSVSPELNGKPAQAKVEKKGDICKINFTAGKDANEVWELTDKTLTQVEYDATGKAGEKYGATNKGDGKYAINCKDKAKNVCDAGVDSRVYWTVKTSPDTITYTLFGIPKDKKGDPTAKVDKRHEFSFKLVK